MSTKSDVTDNELHQLINQTPATELLSHPRVQDVAVDRVLENETFVEKLSDELGLVHEAEIEASITASDDGPDRDHEAFGTGVQGQSESSPEQIEAARRSEELGRTSSHDPKDFTTGVDGADERPLEERDELTAAQRESIRAARSDNQPSKDIEAFGTGVSGDTSRREYRDREERIDIMAEALRRLGVGDDE